MICASVAPGPTGEDPVHRFTEDNVVDDLAVVNSPPAFGLPFYYGAFVAKVCWCRAGGSQPGTAGRRAGWPPSPRPAAPAGTAPDSIQLSTREWEGGQHQGPRPTGTRPAAAAGRR
jgi:hypothetical protein